MDEIAGRAIHNFGQLKSILTTADIKSICSQIPGCKYNTLRQKEPKPKPLKSGGSAESQYLVAEVGSWLLAHGYKSWQFEDLL